MEIKGSVLGFIASVMELHSSLKIDVFMRYILFPFIRVYALLRLCLYNNICL